ENAYLFTQSEQYLKKMEKEKRAYERLGIPSEWLHDMPLDIPIQSALVMKNQAQFHPLQYLKTMVEEAVRNGLRLYENTTAVMSNTTNTLRSLHGMNTVLRVGMSSKR